MLAAIVTLCSLFVRPQSFCRAAFRGSTSVGAALHHSCIKTQETIYPVNTYDNNSLELNELSLSLWKPSHGMAVFRQYLYLYYV